MTARIAIIVVLFVVLACTTPSPIQAQAVIQPGSGCSQVVNQLAREQADFSKTVTDDGMKFLADDALRAAGDAVKPAIEASPTLDGLSKVKDYKEKLDSWSDKCEKYRVTFDDLTTCINTKGCSLLEFARRQNKAFQDWFKGILEEGLPAAVDRVKKASNLLGNYTQRLHSNAANGMKAAVGCMDQYEKAANPKGDVDLRNQPKPKPGTTSGGGSTTPSAPPPAASTPKAGGSHAGAVIVGGVLVAGAAVGVAAVLNATKCTSYETQSNSQMNVVQTALNNLAACGGNSSCFNSRVGTFNTEWSKWASILGNWCTCLGASVELPADQRSAVQQLWATLPSMGLNPGTMPSCFR